VFEFLDERGCCGKQIADVSQAPASHAQVRAERMTQRMDRRLLDASLSANPLERLEDVRVDVARIVGKTNVSDLRFAYCTNRMS
jgi:hypothetical protein